MKTKKCRGKTYYKNLKQKQYPTNTTAEKVQFIKIYCTKILYKNYKMSPKNPQKLKC